MPIQEHFLYTDVIEFDGKLNREPTIAGAILMIAAGTLIALIVGYVLLVLSAFL
jgi:hypothetical protein